MERLFERASRGDGKNHVGVFQPQCILAGHSAMPESAGLRIISTGRTFVSTTSL